MWSDPDAGGSRLGSPALSVAFERWLEPGRATGRPERYPMRAAIAGFDGAMSLPDRPGLAITLQAGRPALQVAGKAGEQYVIEYVPALPATGNWLFQSSFLLTNSPQTIIDPTFTGESKRFYCVRANP